MLAKLKAVALPIVALGVLAFTAAPAAAFAATGSTGNTASPSSTSQTAAPAQAAQPTAPVTGTATNSLGQTVNFVGTFTPTSFSGTQHTLNATGTLTGTLRNTVTGVTQTVAPTPMTTPVTATDPSCPILNLTLAPLDLDLLGLQVHLNQVVLAITAQSGSGNLLGNLLCSVANLLNQNGSGNMIPVSNLLNHILSLL